MKTTNRIRGMCSGVLVAAGLHSPTARAELIVAIDMNSSLAGIQSTRSASPGDSITAEIIFDLDGEPAGLSSYGVSLQFDNTKLILDGSPAASELLPSGFTFNLTPGVTSEINDIGGGLGQVSTFEAATFGLGPTNGTFTIGTIHFKVLTPLPAVGASVTLGLFNVGIDGLFDNSSRSLDSVSFNSGSIVPASSTQEVLLIERSGSNVIFSWPALNLALHLESSITLKSPSWNIVNTPVISANGTNSVKLPMSGSAEFFRLRP